MIDKNKCKQTDKWKKYKQTDKYKQRDGRYMHWTIG